MSPHLNYENIYIYISNSLLEENFVILPTSFDTYLALDSPKKSWWLRPCFVSPWHPPDLGVTWMYFTGGGCHQTGCVEDGLGSSDRIVSYIWLSGYGVCHKRQKKTGRIVISRILETTYFGLKKSNGFGIFASLSPSPLIKFWQESEELVRKCYLLYFIFGTFQLVQIFRIFFKEADNSRNLQ